MMNRKMFWPLCNMITGLVRVRTVSCREQYNAVWWTTSGGGPLVVVGPRHICYVPISRVTH